MVKVRITNPTCASRSYSWIPMGLCLDAGASKVVNFDPFTSCRNGMQLNLLSRDVKLGYVKLTYSVDAPCEVTTIDHLYDGVGESKVQPKEQTTVKADKQIKAVLDVAEKTEKEATPILPKEDLKEAKKNTPVDIFGDRSLEDTNAMKVSSPLTQKEAMESVPEETPKTVEVFKDKESLVDDGELLVTSPVTPKKRSRAKKVQA